MMVIVSPPPTKPSEPAVSAGAAASLLRRLGAQAVSIDASMGWHRFVLSPAYLAQALDTARDLGLPSNRLTAFARSARAVQSRPLRRLETYLQRRRYTSAIADLENALALVASSFHGFRLGVAFAGSREADERPEARAWLEACAFGPSPFDAYFLEELIPAIAALNPRQVGISLTFQQQGPATFRLARLLSEHLPEVPRVLGGPLVACWVAAQKNLSGPPFNLFHQLLAGSDADMAALARSLGALQADEAQAAAARRQAPLAGALEEGMWEDYLSPLPTVPAALGAGCSWRRCTFCPDHLHGKHRPCTEDALGRWVRQVADRFPTGAMLHLTDSALPPEHLEHLAQIIRTERLPLQWHGFTRVEAAYADPAFARHLAEGGCAMLQLGVETASERLLHRLGKGAGAALAGTVVESLAQAGIRTHLYLLFGVPGETDQDREETLAFVIEHGEAIHAINPSLLNLPRGSPMHRHPDRYDITAILPFHDATDLSLYDDFRCGDSHPRLEARRWLERRFFKHPAVRRIEGNLRSPFKANHLCFMPAESDLLPPSVALPSEV